jgi:hypothetical protein
MKMKKYFANFVPVLILVLTVIFLLPNLAFGCFNPTDSFAVEVLLNKPGITYNLNSFENAENVNIENGAIIYRSHYNKDIAVILSEVNTPLKGLSVKLQVPTKTVTIRYTQTQLRLYLDKKLTVDESFLESLGYEITGESSGETLKIIAAKDNVNIAIWSAGGEDGIRSGFSAIIRKELSPELKEELKSIALSLGISEEEWNSAKIETRTVEDIDLEALNEYLEGFDFKKAIKVELEWLRNNEVISGLDDSDIQQISQLARAGLAGHNSRIVWESDWKPYYETSHPMLLKGGGCGGFPVENLPAGELAQLGVVGSFHTNRTTAIIVIGVMGAIVCLFFIIYIKAFKRKE